MTLSSNGQADLEAYIGSLQPATRSSLLIDLQQGKRLEVEGLLGFAVRLGETHRIATPIMSALYSVLKPRGRGSSERAARLNTQARPTLAPPSTASATPETYDARSEHRKAATFANSSGSAIRPSGTAFPRVS